MPVADTPMALRRGRTYLPFIGHGRTRRPPQPGDPLGAMQGFLQSAAMGLGGFVYYNLFGADNYYDEDGDPIPVLPIATAARMDTAQTASKTVTITKRKYPRVHSVSGVLGHKYVGRAPSVRSFQRRFIKRV